MSHHTGTVPLCSTSGSTVTTLRTSTTCTPSDSRGSLCSQDFEHDAADLSEEEADGSTIVPFRELHVGARDATLDAACVRTLELTRPDGDAPHLRLVALEDLEL